MFKTSDFTHEQAAQVAAKAGKVGVMVQNFDSLTSVDIDQLESLIARMKRKLTYEGVDIIPD